MGVLKVTLVISLICIAYVSAQYRQSSSDANIEETNLEEVNNSPSFAGTISSMVVDWISRAIQYMFELFDLKIRTVRFMASLYTTDNLVLLKRFLNVGLRFGGWIYSVIPDSVSEGNNRFLSYLFPQSDLIEASAGKEEDVYANEVSPGTLDDTARSWPWNHETPTKSAPRSNEFDAVHETEKQVVNLHTLINARGNFKH